MEIEEGEREEHERAMMWGDHSVAEAPHWGGARCNGFLIPLDRMVAQVATLQSLLSLLF